VGDASPIIGHAAALDRLREGLRRNRLQHAWIFHGPQGVGKSTVALELARLLLDPETTPVDIDRFAAPRESETARLIAGQLHPDLHVIRRELAMRSRSRELRRKKLTNLPIDLLREYVIGGHIEGVGQIDGPAYLTAVRGHGKVFIIEEAELIERGGQNALLKCLEEPPPRTWFILVTAREHELLPTIHSRCQRLAFTPLAPLEFDTWLSRSSVALGGAEGDWLRRLAGGAPGVATFAAAHDLASWHRELAPQIANLAAGQFSAGLPDTMFTMVESLAEALVKERVNAAKAAGDSARAAQEAEESDDDGDGDVAPEAGGGGKVQASKQSAKDDALRWMVAVLGDEIRHRLRHAVTSGGSPAPWLHQLSLLNGLERQAEANLNLRHILADFVAMASAGPEASILSEAMS